MKEYVFNEQANIEAMMAHSYVDPDVPCRTIKKLARYCYYVLKLDNKDSYTFIHQYMQSHCKDYTEVGFYKSIQGCIRDAHKSRWKQIDQVIITQHELDIIRSLNDDRQEKIAFILLADAKYDNAYKDQMLNLSYLSMSDIYKMARVTMPIRDRAIFLNFLYKNGLVDLNLNPTSINKKLNYISADDSQPGIVLSENNYKELAFTYMNYKYGGYKECKGCGVLIKIKGNTQYCKSCAPRYEKLDVKTIVCLDCGKQVVTIGNSNRKIRCDACQHAKQLEYQRNAMNKKRQCEAIE